MTQTEGLCPCGAGKSYEECCGRFHRDVLPTNALKLMRSRFSAYVLDLQDYIIRTTHPACPQHMENKALWKRKLSQFSKSSTFHKLEVLDFQEDGLLATVTFVVYLSQEEQDVTFTEKSYFQKVGGQWLYLWGRSTQGCVPAFVAKHPFRFLPLAYYGERILREKAHPIADITDEIKLLVEEMIATMHASSGIGLAAPQVHHSLRLFVIQAPVEVAKGKFEPGEVEVFINPKLSNPSLGACEIEEGCLSIPGVRAKVSRPKEVTVEYTNLKGEVIKKRVSGWEARVIMHENDHINGVLFIDRLESEKRAVLDSLLNQLKNRLK